MHKWQNKYWTCEACWGDTPFCMTVKILVVSCKKGQKWSSVPKSGKNLNELGYIMWAGYSDWLRAGRSGDRIPVVARFFAPVQTGSGAHPASCTMGAGSFPEVKSDWGVTLTPHHLLVPWSWKSRAIPLLPLWAVRPVQSLSACTRGHFTHPPYALRS
jgi:hypothetical protein